MKSESAGALIFLGYLLIWPQLDVRGDHVAARRNVGRFMTTTALGFYDTYQRGNISCRMWATVEDPDTPPKALPFQVNIEGRVVWVKETGQVC